jgi:hypothetical protein
MQLQLTASPRSPKWKDLSDKHKEVREQLEAALNRFKDANPQVPNPASSIVGVYGSGKSELMAYGFKYCWKELRLPALMINLEILLQALPPEPLEPSKFADCVTDFVHDQLARLHSQLVSRDRPAGLCLANDLRPNVKLSWITSG